MLADRLHSYVHIFAPRGQPPVVAPQAVGSLFCLYGAAVAQNV